MTKKESQPQQQQQSIPESDSGRQVENKPAQVANRAARSHRDLYREWMKEVHGDRWEG